MNPLTYHLSLSSTFDSRKHHDRLIRPVEITPLRGTSVGIDLTRFDVSVLLWSFCRLLQLLGCAVLTIYFYTTRSSQAFFFNTL